MDDADEEDVDELVESEGETLLLLLLLLLAAVFVDSDGTGAGATRFHLLIAGEAGGIG